MESHCAGRPGEPAGPHRRRCHRRARVPFPRHPGHLDHRPLRRGRRLGRRQRKDAEADRRRRLRKNLPLPEFTRRLLPRATPIAHESPVPEIRRPPPRCAGARRGWRGQADQRAGHGDPDGRHDLRPRGSRAVLRARSSAARRIRSTLPAWSPPISFAATCRSPLGCARATAFLLDVREMFELAVESVPGAINIPLGATPLAPRRVAARPEYPGHLPLRRAAPTTRRGSCCRTGSTPRRLPAACCHVITPDSWWIE